MLESKVERINLTVITKLFHDEYQEFEFQSEHRRKILESLDKHAKILMKNIGVDCYISKDPNTEYGMIERGVWIKEEDYNKVYNSIMNAIHKEIQAKGESLLIKENKTGFFFNNFNLEDSYNKWKEKEGF